MPSLPAAGDHHTLAGTQSDVLAGGLGSTAALPGVSGIVTAAY